MREYCHNQTDERYSGKDAIEDLELAIEAGKRKVDKDEEERRRNKQWWED